MVVIVGFLYFLLDSALSTLQVSPSSDHPQGTRFNSPCQAIPPVRMAKRLFAAVFARSILFVIGFWWISVEVVNKKRGYVHRESHIFHLLNCATAGGIRRTNAGTHAPGISSSRTGCRGLNSYGSHSGIARLPTRPTLALTAETPTQVRPDIRSPGHGTSPTRLLDLIGSQRPNTGSPDRNRFSRNLKFGLVCLQKSAVDSAGEGGRFQGRFSLVDDILDREDPYSNLGR